MGDRKVINKYYPPDFDPSKLSKIKPPKRSGAAALQTVRLAAPFSMRCTTCGEFIYKGRKFNARKQPTGEEYLGIKIIRFYIRCPRCSGEIRFKTSPQISDYVTELGAVRNHEPWRDKVAEEESLEERLERLDKEQREKDELEEQRKIYGIAGVPSSESAKNADDVMAALEANVDTAKKEMEREEMIDELRARNARIEQNADKIVARAERAITAQEDEAKRRQDEADADEARKIFSRTADGTVVKRAVAPPPPPPKKPAVPILGLGIKKQSSQPKTNSLGVIVKKKKPLV